MKGDNADSNPAKLNNELGESAEVYRTLFDKSPDTIILHRDLKIIKANKAAAKLLDLDDPESMIGRMVTDFIHPDFRSQIEERSLRLDQQGELDSLEQINITEKGRTIYTEAKFILVHYQGEPAVVTMARDITEKKMALSELNKSETMHRAILDEAGLGMGIWSPEGILIKFNKTALMHIGGKSEDYEGKHVKELFGEEEGSIYLNRIQEALEGKKPIVFEDEIDMPGGKKFFRSNFSLIKGKDEEIFGIMIISDDISSMKNIEKEILEREKRYKTLYENMVQGVFYQGPDGQLIDCNEKALEIFGLAREQLMGRTSMDPRWKVVHEDGTDWPGEEHPSMVALRTGDPQIGVVAGVFNPVKDKLIWILINAIPQFREGEKEPFQVFVTIEDISLRKIAETELATIAGSLETMVNSTDEFIMVADKNAKPILFNKAYADVMKEMIGLDMEPGINPHTLLDDLDQKKFWEENHRRVLSGESFRVDFEYRIPGGETRYFDILYHPINDGDEITGFTEYTRDVTDIRKIEEELKAQKNFTESSLDAQLDTFFVFDPETGKAIRWNKRFEELSGYSSDEISNLPAPASYYSNEDLERAAPFVEKVMDEGEGTIILNLKSKDGTLIPTEYNVSLSTDELTGRSLFISVGRDISDRIKTEKALRESEEKLRQIVENSTNLFYVHGIDHVLTYLSPQSLDILGYTPEEAMMNWTEMATDHPINEEGFLKTMTAIETGEPQPPYELQLKKKDGSIVWAEVREAPVVENGKTVAIVGSLTDVTQRKLIQEKLEESEGRFRRLAENARDLIYRMTLPDGRFEYVSPSAFDVTGFDQDDFYNSQGLLIKSFHPDHRDLFNKSWINIMKGEAPPFFEYKIIDKEGNERWINQRNVLVKDEAGNPIALEGIVTNVTESKMAQERLNHLNDLLKAIRDVNQLITMEKNRTDLLKGICESLLETSAFSTSWIVTYNDKGRVLEKVQAGFEKELDDVMKIEDIKDLFICSENVLGSEGVVVFEDIESECSGCPLSKLYPDKSAWSIRLKHIDQDFGILTVSLPKNLRSDEEFMELFEEVAGDISFALHSMDLEKQRDEQDRELRANLDFTSSLIENANAIVLVLDKDANIDTFNSFAEELTGWKKEEVIGKNWFDLFIPDMDKGSINKIFTDVITDVDDHPGNLNPILTKDQKLKFIKWGNTKIRDIEGDVVKTLSIGTDMTEQLEYQDMLKESEERFRLLAENSTDVIWTMDVDGNFIYVSPSIERLRGYTSDEVMTQSFSDLVEPNSFEEVMRLYNEGLAKIHAGERVEEEIILELEQPCKDGSTVWTDSVIKVIYDENGEFAFILGVSRDISEKKSTSDRLKENRELLMSTLESTADGIIVVDKDGRTTHFNDRFLEMWMIPPDVAVTKDNREMIEYVIDQLVDPESFRKKVKILHGTNRRDLDILKFKDGRVFERYSCPLMSDEMVQGRVWSFRDITEKEEALSEVIEQKGLSEFYLDLLSHDIGNLHQGIFSALQLAAMSNDPDRKTMVLGTSEDLVRRSLKLVKNVLLLSRLKVREPEIGPVDLAEVLKSTMQSIRDIYSSRELDLASDIEDDLIVDAEPIVEEVFFNLVQNAVKFQSHVPPMVEIKGRKEDGVAVVEVIDHGFGIPDDQKEKLFQRFSPSGIGSQSGIGLSLVKELILRYHGGVYVKNRIEGDHTKGTCFIVSLPLSIDPHVRK